MTAYYVVQRANSLGPRGPEVGRNDPLHSLVHRDFQNGLLGLRPFGGDGAHECIDVVHILSELLGRVRSVVANPDLDA